MQTFLEIEQFAKLVHLPRDIIDEMIAQGSLKHHEIDGTVYIEAASGTMAVLPSASAAAPGELDFSHTPAGSFIDRTIGTFMSLHEKVLDAKDETLDALRTENAFLREAVCSLQELYDGERELNATAHRELEAARDEIEYLKRKYKLMWNKAIENYEPKQS